MKRLIITVMIFLLCLSACKALPESADSQSKAEAAFEDNSGKASRGIWISFSEINSMLKSEQGFETEFENVIDNCVSLEIQNVYIHVRSYCDSLFESEYFPLISEAEGFDYDIFKFMLDAFHEKGIKVHAWINPYRVLTSSSDIDALNPESPAYKWLKDSNTDNDLNVCFSEGIYLNPAQTEVRQLVINGIREIITNYDVDGIHFDDYFYPTTEEKFDSASYEAYKTEAQKPLSLEAWRRTNVNALISGCYMAIKFFDKDILFTISPAASIEKNYSELYADVETWVKNGYVDCIIPQLYFGFDYPTEEYRFETLLKNWQELMSCNSKVGLLIGLAPYKIGTDTEADYEEWKNKNDIIARQAEMCYKNQRVEGYILFSYSSVFSDNELNLKQRENLKKFIAKSR